MMRRDRSDDSDDCWSPFLGFGACHDLRDHQPDPKGRLPKIKKRPIGFRIPKPSKGHR